MEKYKIAIVGRPNVGKSTLFNRICRKRLAIAHDRPGVTRDVKTYETTWEGLEFQIADTAGIDKASDELTKKMSRAALANAEQADLILFMLDGRAGAISDDKEIAIKMRKLGTPVILVVNKAENDDALETQSIYRLGFEDVVLISAEHNKGMDKLEAAIKRYIKPAPKIDILDDTSENTIERPICISIIGRPNAGKSTLFNCLLGEERSITSSTSGTTRDSITHAVSHNGRNIEIVDTAGLRKKTAIVDAVEQLSATESINAIRRSHVVVMLLDGTCPFEKQDLSILRVAINEGRGVVLVINKCDLITDRSLYKQDIEEYVEEKLFELRDLPVLYVSATKKIGINKILDSVITTYDLFNTKIGTGALNRCIAKSTEAHIPPLGKNGKRIKLKYITQTAVRPPSFTIFGSTIDQLPPSYARYIYNSIKKKFGLFGVPLRITYKKSHNPYHS